VQMGKEEAVIGIGMREQDWQKDGQLRWEKAVAYPEANVRGSYPILKVQHF